MAKIETGFNIALSLNSGKTILGVTSDDLTIEGVTKESITKDDSGVPQVAVVRRDLTFSVSGLYMVKETGDGVNLLGRNQIIALADKTGADAVIAFSYGTGSGDDDDVTVSGTCIITSYSESSAADPGSDPTFTLNLRALTHSIA